MRRLTLVAAALACVGCGGGDGATGPRQLTAADLQGRWEVAPIEGTRNCTGSATATPTYYFTVTSDRIGEAGAMNVVDKWDVVVPYRFDWTVTGNFNVKERTVALNFWHTVLKAGAEVTGTLAADGSFTGTARDPKPGYEGHTVFWGTCTWQVKGRRIGA